MIAKTLNKLNVQSKVTLLAEDIYKINEENDEQYRRLRNQIVEDVWKYPSYQNKHFRSIKVTGRGIDPECQPERKIVKLLKTRMFVIEHDI